MMRSFKIYVVLSFLVSTQFDTTQQNHGPVHQCDVQTTRLHNDVLENELFCYSAQSSEIDFHFGNGMKYVWVTDWESDIRCVPNLTDSYNELRGLDMRYNNLRSCTNDTVYDGNFWKLKELLLPFNELITLPGIVYAAVNVETLDLESNQLVHNPDLSNTHLFFKDINLFFNPVACQCSDTWLKHLSKRHNLEHDNLLMRCSEGRYSGMFFSQVSVEELEQPCQVTEPSKGTFL